MSQIGVRSLAFLGLCVAMVIVGVAGLVGAVQPSPILAAMILAVAVFLGVDAGRRRHRYLE